MSDNAAYYVTLGGDCFEVSPQGKVDPVTRDGLLYKFHATAAGTCWTKVFSSSSRVCSNVVRSRSSAFLIARS